MSEADAAGSGGRITLKKRIDADYSVTMVPIKDEETVVSVIAWLISLERERRAKQEVRTAA